VSFAFYVPFNLTLLSLLFLGPRARYGGFRRVFYAAAFYALLHIVTALLIVNQFRYLMVATPPLLIVASVALGQTNWWRTARISVPRAAIALIVLATPNMAMSWRSHYEGIRDQEMRNNLASSFATMPTGTTVMVALDLTKGFKEQLFGFVLRPRRVLYISDRYSPDDYAALIKNVDAKWLISPRHSLVLSRLAPRQLRQLRALPAPFTDWSLFSLE
jgi:hypothetical protein